MKKRQRIQIQINDIAYGGNGISKLEYKNTKNFIVFVKNAIPGQIVLAQIKKIKPNPFHFFEIFIL